MQVSFQEAVELCARRKQILFSKRSAANLHWEAFSMFFGESEYYRKGKVDYFSYYVSWKCIDFLYRTTAQMIQLRKKVGKIPLQF